MRNKIADECARTISRETKLWTTGLENEQQTWLEYLMGSSNWCIDAIVDLSMDSHSRIHNDAAKAANTELDRLARKEGFSKYKIFFSGEQAYLERDTAEGVRIVDVSGWWKHFLKEAEAKERSRLRALLVTRPEDI